jgi:hypothetical protein
VPPSDQIFADGFESGTTSAWTSAIANNGRLSVTTGAALSGRYGLQAAIANRNDMYVADASPAAVSTYHARFEFDPNGVSVGSGKFHDIFVGLNNSSATVTRVQVAQTNSGYQLRTGATLNSGSTKYGAWTTISDAPHVVDVTWQAATSASSGTQRLTVDGVLANSVSNLTNSAMRIDTVRLGAQSVPTGVSGIEFFDGFASALSIQLQVVATGASAMQPALRIGGEARLARSSSDR